MAMTEFEQLEELLQKIERLADRDPAEALAELERARPELRRRPEARLLAADLTWETAGAPAARELFGQLVTDEPDYADARHLYGCLLEELGEEQGKVEQFLEVLRLDDALSAELDGYDERELEDLIVTTAEQALERLPASFRGRLSGVPILVQPRPDEHLVEEGFDPRALGLFDGPSDLDHRGTETAPSPTRIVLYSMNLLAESVDEDQLRAEVETTVLHEIGHYFGLDEDDLDRIGLG